MSLIEMRDSPRAFKVGDLVESTGWLKLLDHDAYLEVLDCYSDEKGHYCWVLTKLGFPRWVNEQHLRAA